MTNDCVDQRSGCVRFHLQEGHVGGIGQQLCHLSDSPTANHPGISGKTRMEPFTTFTSEGGEQGDAFMP